MIYEAIAEIISMDRNYGAARTEQEMFEKLALAHVSEGTWAAAVEAGAADEPMRVIVLCDASGTYHQVERGEVGHADDYIRKPDALAEGMRVGLVESFERFPHFTLEAGATGVVKEARKDLVIIKIDEHIPGCEAWDNEILFSLPEEAEELASAVRLLGSHEPVIQADPSDDRFDVEAIDEAVALAERGKRAEHKALAARLRALRSMCETFQPDAVIRGDIDCPDCGECVLSWMEQCPKCGYDPKDVVTA